MDTKDFQFRFQIVDEVNENHEIDLTLDEDLERPHVKQERDDVYSEEGQGESLKGDLEEECNGDSLRQPPSEDVTEDVDPEIQVKLKPEDTSTLSSENNAIDTSGDFKDDSDECLSEPHPYLYIAETFEFQKEQVTVTSTENLKRHENSMCHIIKNTNSIMRMLNTLRNSKEIGVDIKMSQLEFTGSICTMQISTGETDFILDAMKLKNELMILTEIFINPKIVKVLLRPRSVLASLQKKLHLYLINIFDLQEAKAMLNESNRSLSSILKSELNVELDDHNNVDFRQRPIPPEHRDLLKVEIHYLVHLYHLYKNKLINQDFDQYKQFLEKCRDLCKVTFPEIRHDTLQSYEEEFQKRHKCELEVLKKLYLWRRSTARRLNIRPEMVLHKPGLVELVRYLPTSDKDILSFAKSTHVKKDLANVRKLILESRSEHLPPVVPKKKKQEPPKQGVKRNASAMQSGKRSKAYSAFIKNLAKDNQKVEKRFQESGAQKRKRMREHTRVDVDERQSSPKKNANVTPWAKKTYFPENFETNSVILNPTTIPSSFTFQTNAQESPGNEFSGGPWGQTSSNPRNSFGRNQSDGFGRPNTNFQKFDTNSQTFSHFDQRIDNLERQFQQGPSYNNRNYNESTYRRRY